MPAPIGSLVASLTLESAAFIRDLGKAANSVNANTSKMQRSLASLESTAKRAFGGFVGVMAVRSLTSIAKAAIDTGDEIGATATKLGIGTEALQRLRFAAEQTDVGVDELNAAFKLFQKNLSEGKVTASTGDLVGAFDELLTKIREAPTQLEKVSIAVDAAGKQYQTLLSIAAQGETFSKSLRGAYTISEEGIQIASELDNKLRAIQNAAQAGFQTGFLEAFVGKLGDGGNELDDLNSAMAKLGGIVGGIVSRAGGFIDKVAKFMNDHPGFTNFVFNPDPTFGASTERDTSIGMGKGTVVGKGVSNLAPSIEQQQASIGAWRTTVEVVNQATEAYHANAEAITYQNTAITDGIGRSLEFNDLMKEGVSVYADMRTPMQEYADDLQRISLLQQTGAIDAQTFARAHQQLTLGMASNWTGAAGAVSGALATIFKENKAVAAANVIINTADAVISALKNPPGPPFSYAYAAAAAATGAAQLATILSTNPGSGAKSTAIKAGKTTAATSVKAANDNGSRAAGGLTQTVTLKIEGDVFGPAHFRKIVEGINGVQRDGTAVLRIA